MMKKFYFILINIILTSNWLFSQTVTIDGYCILDKETDYSNIMVVFKRTTPSVEFDTVFTDSEGYFSKIINTGIYDITYSSANYLNKILNNVYCFSDKTLESYELLPASNIIKVPEVVTSIQEAIDIAQSGDTILVSPGIYYENINYKGKSILLTSQYLYSNDKSDIDNTIIDGGSNSSVVAFENNENQNSILNGFSIRNGYAQNVTQKCFGGGIRCWPASPTLMNLKVYNNYATWSGGGICMYESYTTLKNVEVFDNKSHDFAGGIVLVRGSVEFDNILIYNNEAGYGIGSGIRCFNGTYTIRNSTIGFNLNGGISIYDSNVSIQNSIISNNFNGYGIEVENGDSPLINFCNVWANEKGAFAGCNPLFGQNVTINANGDPCDPFNNISLNPLFQNISNNNYKLMNGSPCLDAGNNSNVEYNMDINNNSRIWDGNKDGVEIVDLGAFEYNAGYYLLSGKNYCENDTIVYHIYIDSAYNPDNEFILQLSDISDSFLDPLELHIVKTSTSIVIKSSFPNTLTHDKQYLLRVKSTNPETYSDIDTVIFHKTPTSAFSIDTSKLCGADTVLVSYIGTGTENANYNWDFSNGNIISGTGQGNYKLNWSNSGLKTLSLSVSENGCFSQVSSTIVTVYQPNSSFSMDNVVCENQNTSISFNGMATDSAFFDWNFAEANIISESNESYLVNWDSLGVKEISLIINDNGCLSSQTIKSIDHNPIPTTTITVPNKVCYNGTANIEYLGTATNSASYNWNFDNGTILSGTGEGPYEIAWGNSGIKTISLNIIENGCSSDTSVSLSVNQQTQTISICMVSVDTSNHNMIVWEQPSENPFDSIIIYKETSQSDVYAKIASHPSSTKTVFIDENSNPAQNSSRYKIAVLDTCGYETFQSDYHKTMHLTINSGINGAWNLIWDGYEGFDYSTYNIYRGTSDGNMLKIAEQASNTFTFTDLTPPYGTVYYQIEIENPNSCNISNLKTTNNYFGSSRSNIVNSGQIISIDNFSFKGIEIYPNPANDKIYINSDRNYNYGIEILSLDGKLLIKNKNILNSTEIDISCLNSGIYIVKLSNDRRSLNIKLIKR